MPLKCVPVTELYRPRVRKACTKMLFLLVSALNIASRLV